MDPSKQREHLRLAAEISGVDVEIVLPARRHTVVGGFRLHYLDWGTHGRQPIVFLHGVALNAHTWDVVCLAMRERYHCLALDQRGHGDSEWAPDADYSPEAHLRDIEGFADHLGLDQFVLVGHSMGGLNALVYANTHSDRLAALAIVDIGPGMRSGGAQRIRDFVAETAELDSLEDAVEKALAFNPRRDPRLLRHSLQYNLRELPSGKWARKHDLRMWKQGELREKQRARIREYFKDTHRIKCPTLIIRGAASDVFLDEDAEKFAQTFPKGRYVRIEGAGHTVQGDNPRALSQALAQFLDR
jgi:esterase